jgi:hypothetical protein
LCLSREIIAMAYQVSPDNTILTTPGGVIVDSYGNSWGLTAGGQVIVNGKIDATSSRVLTLAFEKGKVWQMNTDRLWWSKAKPTDAWGPAYGTTVSPLVGVASADNTLLVGSVTAGHILADNQIIDANDDHWSVTAAGQVSLNGVVDATTKNVIAIAYDKGMIWQENASKLWYGKTNAHSAWSAGTATSPVGAGQTGVTYFDGTSVSFLNTASPANYGIFAVADGDNGIYLNYQGVNTTAGTIRDAENDLTINLGGGGSGPTLTNSGTIISQGGIGGARIHLSIVSGATFLNTGRIDISDSLSVNNTLTVNMHGGTFNNAGVVQANGDGQTISVMGIQGWGPITTFYTGTTVNNGLMQVTNGASMFINTPVSGAGTLEALEGSRIGLNGPVAAGQTVHIDASVLEFGAKGNVANPSMQFLGKIVGESPTSTILLDGSYGTSESFRAISSAGAGMAELAVFDQSHVMVADLQFVGHFQLADFTLTPHFGASGLAADNWTAITFSNHANTTGTLHS